MRDARSTGGTGGGSGTIVNSGFDDLSIKFGITTAGNPTTAQVSDTFTAVHNYLATKPTATNVGTENATLGDIKLGDYIDLPSLNVTGYPWDSAGVTYGKIANVSGSGGRFRLIVVGINSFNQGQGGSYTGNGNGTAPHLVFQFQNIPVNRRMRLAADMKTNYKVSEMRQYLTLNFLLGA